MQFVPFYAVRAESLRKYTAKWKRAVYFSLSAGDASSRR